ncbi:MAG: hypothetical protein GF334_07950 [Candidatus Altiarchaeales archaeon]|nr:hypothetical protein [Candidatus Altiarchaeales archaeon]
MSVNGDNDHPWECDACGGAGQALSGPCMCGGSGLAVDAVRYLRERVYCLEQEIEKLEANKEKAST